MAATIRLAERLAGLFLLAVAVLTFVMVILRKGFDTAIPDWYDFSRLIQGIAILWGLACACWRGSHIQVDLVWDWLSPVNRRRLDLFAGAAVLLFMGAFAAMALEAAWGLRAKNLLTNDLRLPVWGFYMLGALGVAAAAWATMGYLRHVARHGHGPDENPDTPLT